MASPTKAQHQWLADHIGFDPDAPATTKGVRAAAPSARAPVKDGGAAAADAGVGVVGDAPAPPAPKPVGQQPMPPDCKLQPNMVDGPANHMLCTAHGHVVDTVAKVIIADSVADYDAMFPVPRPQAADCAPEPGKMPHAPGNIQLCAKHGHVLDIKTKQIVANTPSMFGRKQVPGGHAPPQPAPPDPPPHPQPQPPNPQPDPPNPPPDPPPHPGPPDPPPDPQPDPPSPFPKGLFAHEITAKQLADMDNLLTQFGQLVDQATFDAEQLPKDIKQRGIDDSNMEAVAQKLQAGVKSVDQEALKTLRNAKAIVDEAGDGASEVIIEFNDAQARIKALQKLLHLPDVKATTKQLEDIDAEVNTYDLALNLQKGMLDFISDPTAFGVTAAILEVADSDTIKDKFKDALKEEAKLADSVDQLIDTLRSFQQADAQAEAGRLQQLAEVRQSRLTHYQTAVTTFISDLNTLPPNAGGKLSPDIKAITDSYAEVVKVNERMKELLRVAQGSATLHDPELTAALNPLGELDQDLTNHARQLIKTALVYANGPKLTLFTMPANLTQETLEAMPGRLKQVLRIEAEAKKTADYARKWQSMMDSGFSM